MRDWPTFEAIGARRRELIDQGVPAAEAMAQAMAEADQAWHELRHRDCRCYSDDPR